MFQDCLIHENFQGHPLNLTSKPVSIIYFESGLSRSLTNVVMQNAVLLNSKRKLECELAQLQSEMEDTVQEAKNTDEKAKKAFADVQ